VFTKASAAREKLSATVGPEGEGRVQAHEKRCLRYSHYEEGAKVFLRATGGAI